MVGFDITALRQVGDGPGDAQNPVIAPRGEPEAFRRPVQQVAALGIRGGDLLQQAAFGVGVQRGVRVTGKAMRLQRSGGADAGGDGAILRRTRLCAGPGRARRAPAL